MLMKPKDYLLSPFFYLIPVKERLEGSGSWRVVVPKLSVLKKSKP